jgi:hypothetical protein
MHTRQGVVAEPALFQHSPDNYEQDAHDRAAMHQQFWSGEPLTDWQEFILCRELDCTGRHSPAAPSVDARSRLGEPHPQPVEL